jgi:hypothetical protein
MRWHGGLAATLLAVGLLAACTQQEVDRGAAAPDPVATIEIVEEPRPTIDLADELVPTTAAPGDGEPAPTVIPPPPTGVAQPAPGGGLAPPDGALHVEGTYEGIEELRLRWSCPDLTQWFDAAFEHDDGTVWQYRAEYCGASADGQWHGEGTFTFTAADGSTLTGDFLNTADTSVDGEPYSLTISSGTGAFAGASGECILTLDIEDVDFGTNAQSGGFMCDVER